MTDEKPNIYRMPLEWGGDWAFTHCGVTADGYSSKREAELGASIAENAARIAELESTNKQLQHENSVLKYAVHTLIKDRERPPKEEPKP
jgi:hypothetical protein